MAAKTGSLVATNKSTPKHKLKYKEQPLPVPARIAPDHPDHRSTQPYQGAAPVRHHSQVLNSNPPPQQQPYSVPNQAVFSPQSGLQSPFLHQQPQYQQQQPPADTGYYQSHPSPRSTSTSGPYYAPDKSDPMAAAATMQRPQYPPIYHTPQSNSPASVTSPQHDHGRPMFAQPSPQLAQPMYGYPQYQSLSQMHQPSYSTHNAQSQSTHQMSAQPLLPYQSSTPQLQHQSSTIASSPRLKQETSQWKQESNQWKQEASQSYQTPAPSRQSTIQQYQHPPPVPPQANTPISQNQPNAPPSSSNAAPGPIPATTPLVVRQDNNGVQWIAFEYSRDRVKMEYTIRCDVESVNTESLTPEFKSENCVYPRACVPKDQYKGNRLAYETDCNQVGWALAELNTCLRGKRGLIQRAVDSWRNSNQDPRLRSRRVRRQAKMNHRNKPGSAASQVPGSSAPVSTGLPGSGSMAAPSTRPPGVLPSAPQPPYHHHQNDVSPTGHEAVGVSPYSQPQYKQHTPTIQHMTTPVDLRQGHAFPGYQTYPSVPTSLGPSMPPTMQGGMHHLGRPGGPAAMVSKGREDRFEEDAALFGDVPEGKRRKFILVEDTQKNNSRIRVKVTLDQVEMSEIPDSYRKNNSVFPRAYYPVQMQTEPEHSREDRFAEEQNSDDEGATVGKTTVPLNLPDGDAEIEVPKISRSKRSREQKINELGYRMAWGQGRIFSGRPIFLAKALDAYRIKQRNSLMTAGQETSAIPAHLETRPGKRRWLERTRPGALPLTPQEPASD